MEKGPHFGWVYFAPTARFIWRRDALFLPVLLISRRWFITTGDSGISLPPRRLYIYLMLRRRFWLFFNFILPPTSDRAERALSIKKNTRKKCGIGKNTKEIRFSLALLLERRSRRRRADETWNSVLVFEFAYASLEFAVLYRKLAVLLRFVLWSYFMFEFETKIRLNFI